jgi:glycosyltransferase involved in cell wall biosynthesis
MSILHVISTLDPKGGGTTEAVRLLHDTLIEQGHTSEVLCCGNPEASWVKDWGNKAHVLGHGQYRWAYHPQWIPWLEANIDRFDVVIMHGLWLYPSYAVHKMLKKRKADIVKAESEKWETASRKRKSNGEASTPQFRHVGVLDFQHFQRPYFVFPHGMLDPWFQKAPERRLKAIRNWIYWKLIERYVIQDAAGLLFTCEQELLLARTSFRPYQPKKELNVGYGIAEPPAFHPAMRTAFEDKCPKVRGRPYLLFLSRIHPKKGVDLLIHAYAKLAARHGGECPDLVIAGPGLETAYGQEMQRLAAELTPSLLSAFSSPLSPFPQIHFPGMVTGDAKWGAFYRCEAFVLPSHQENFGIAVVESLACGIPVLISDQVNIWREIKNAGAGWVAPDTELGTLEMLETWSEQTSCQREEMSLSARRAYETHFGIAGAAGRLWEALCQDQVEQEVAV